MLKFRAAAIADVGVVQLPSLMVRDQIARGELVQVVPGWAPRSEIIHAVLASRRGLLTAVRAPSRRRSRNIRLPHDNPEIEETEK